ncbi:MAG: hypothetical protein ACRDP6_24620 [Actinoallomurus sp.]
MAEYLIKVSGCDDNTCVIADLTDAELEPVERIAAQVKTASEFGCQPVIRIIPLAAADEDDLEKAGQGPES